MKGSRNTFKIKTALSSPYTISYINYGNPNALHQIFCCHGLTRNAMDFDPLSKYLCSNHKQKSNNDAFNITSIDLCGRGHSDFVSNHSLYKIGHHLIECDDLINHLRSISNNSDIYSKKETMTWIGTSLGGIIGMYYAAFYYPTIKHLILNDIGPFLPKEFINKLREFSNNNPLAKDMNEMEQKLRERYTEQYGPDITDDDWKRMVKDGTYYDEKECGYKLAYDVNVCEGLLMDINENDNGSFDDWDIFKDVWIKIPKDVKILAVRGQNSTLLTRETVDKMIETNSNLSVVEIEDVGHHPLLCDKIQMDIIAQFIGLVASNK